MITLNDYLYSGDTVFRILKKYSEDLKRAAEENQSEVDLLHYYFLLQIMELLEHNDFLTAQSQKIREFYQYMAKQYPYLSFTFKGRIKSLIRAEAKFNGYIVAYVYDYYLKNHAYPPVDELKERLTRFRDLIAYRIVISMPKCHVRDEREREQEEIRYLYEIANRLKVFLEERGFIAEPAGGVKLSDSPLLNEDVRPYYRDYIVNEESDGYRSLHITFLITVHIVMWRCSFGQKRWMISRRSGLQTIWDMRKSRSVSVQDEMLFRWENAFILMRHMKEE